MSRVGSSEGVLDVGVAGETLRLDAERALYWPARATLVVADVHFGKGQVLREGGVPLPRGSTAGDLARLDALIARHVPARLLVLGDLVHGPTRPDAEWIARVRCWRDRHAGLACVLVRGNHDRRLDAGALGFSAVEGTALEAPFVFAHDPRPDARGYVLAGHAHPGIVLRERHAPRARLPVFWFGAGVGVLPAFGRLTGLMPVRHQPRDRVFAVAPGMVLPIAPAS